MSSRGIELPQDWMELRKAKGLSLVQIAIATKIRLRYLEAIERGAFQELPGGVYTESYIRQYARAVDDVDNALLDYYRNVFAPQTVQPLAEPEPESWLDAFRDVVRSLLGLTPDAPLAARKRRAA
ncbi:MAG: helix-turn-helix domain-containing protein [Bryobacteraceae bacterium]|jgi:transcriptional regulator with XRE-family HTH domain